MSNQDYSTGCLLKQIQTCQESFCSSTFNLTKSCTLETARIRWVVLQMWSKVTVRCVSDSCPSHIVKVDEGADVRDQLETKSGLRSVPVSMRIIWTASPDSRMRATPRHAAPMDEAGGGELKPFTVAFDVQSDALGTNVRALVVCPRCVGSLAASAIKLENGG